VADYTKPVYRKLKEHDCIFIRRGKGDHSIYYSPITKRNFAVDGKIEKRHMANWVMTLAGIDYIF
jgi:hypothetical protein